jgi:hypothetical protein
MYLIPVSCPRRMIDVQLVIGGKECAEGIYKDLLSAVGEHGYQISPIMEVDQTFATDLIRARSEAEAEFVYHLIRRELNP